MANVEKWSNNRMEIKWGKEFFSYVCVDTAILDKNVQCLHCGKNIQKGKLVFCAVAPPNYFPSSRGDSGWGEDSYKPTFCSSNHAKLFAKNNNGL
jgi:hypothetical protein